MDDLTILITTAFLVLVAYCISSPKKDTPPPSPSPEKVDYEYPEDIVVYRRPRKLRRSKRIMKLRSNAVRERLGLRPIK